MANKPAKASHKPERTCVVCKKKKPKEELIRFIVMDSYYVIDYRCSTNNTNKTGSTASRRKDLPGRGYYLCNENDCIVRLDKWMAKQKKKKRSKKGRLARDNKKTLGQNRATDKPQNKQINKEKRQLVTEGERNKDSLTRYTNKNAPNNHGQQTIDKLTSYLHLATKAGKVKIGMSATFSSCVHHHANLILCAEDISSNSLKKINKIAGQQGVTLIIYGDKELYSAIFDREVVAIVSIEERNIAEAVQKILG